MRLFQCDHCGHLVFFDSVHCVSCGSQLAFLPDMLEMGALVPAPQDGHGLWRRVGRRGAGQHGGALYRLCRNHTDHQACNFAISVHDHADYCVSCRQTRMLPDLSDLVNRHRWMQIEAAKRRLFYTLARLGLAPGRGSSAPLFEFLADMPGSPAVLTGHFGGTITLNVAEADDAERARRRIALGEPYRTLIGHLRHESGHFYWDQLVSGTERIHGFRDMFGDERQDYGAALDAHYAKARDGSAWGEHYVSAYAAAHPWEDWAETWAHYLHMVDLLETSSSYATEIAVPGAFGEQRVRASDPFSVPPPEFGTLVQQLVPLTLLLNSLNRGLGQPDAYPFTLANGVVAKLRFVHELVRDVSSHPVSFSSGLDLAQVRHGAGHSGSAGIVTTDTN